MVAVDWGYTRTKVSYALVPRYGSNNIVRWEDVQDVTHWPMSPPFSRENGLYVPSATLYTAEAGVKTALYGYEASTEACT